MEYLSLPFILRDGYLSKTDLRQSIAYSIGLLLSTRPGAMPFEPEYGCNIWEKEFSDIQTTNKADIRASLRNAIDIYEKRLYNVSVSFVNVEDSAPHSLGLTVRVSGNYRDGDREESFDASYQLG
ncbi:MAG: GPW/gp25 family protein [candidate division Zixibacteria bacterium]|nr:GPW/gp25 family protein [candidate division Zixibacteria bacterium]